MRVTHCDGPDCQAAASDLDEEDDEGWLHLEAYNVHDCGDYCSWQCLANAAMSRTLDG